MVARRTGTPRTPYSVYIKGKKWKDFENDDHAEAVANKLRAKFRAEGRDPSVITVAPTDIPEDVNEGLLYSGDTWQDVLYRINVLNDIFGDQKDLAASFEPASQPEWGPFRDRILRSRTVLDTYAKVKQLANMNVPLTDVEIEMLADVAWDGGGGPVEPAGHWGENDYDWLENLYAQQFAVVQHLLDQKAQGRGQNRTKSGQTVHEQGVAEVKADPTGTWVVYNGNKVKRFKSHDGAKAYAGKNGGKVASSEFYADKIQGVTESTMSNVHAAMADVYHRLAPGIERNRDSFKAGQLYDELENIAELHGIEPEFKRMMNNARNRAHMEYDTNPGGFQNWFWFLPFGDDIDEGMYDTLGEEQDTSGVESAIIRRIMVAHKDWLVKFGPQKVMQAAEEVAYNVGDVDEIGTSDVSAYVHQVGQILGAV